MSFEERLEALKNALPMVGLLFLKTNPVSWPMLQPMMR